MPLLIIFILFIVVPATEIALFIEIGGIVGIWWTIILTFATAAAGTIMLRVQGLGTLRRAEAAIAREEAPVAELIDGLCLLLAGLALLIPGFATDAFGLLLFVPLAVALAGEPQGRARSRPRHAQGRRRDDHHRGRGRGRDRRSRPEPAARRRIEVGPAMILVRHGESEFNVVFSQNRVDPGIVDPGLTATGRRQAREAAAALSGYDIGQVISSPYTRALETAAIIGDRLGLPIDVEPLVRERGYFTCDIGTPASALRQAWPDHEFDHLDEIWWREEESEAELDNRSAAFRRRIAGHPDWRRVAIVAHWGFIKSLTGVQLGNGEFITYDPAEGCVISA